MTERYDKGESLNRVLRYWQGNPSDDTSPETLPGEVLSENQALANIAQLLGDYLPGESLTLPNSVGNAIGNAGFFRGWGGGHVIHVNQKHANASDANTGLNANYPLSTIQQGVDNGRAMSGDTILVLQNDGWTYGSDTSDNIVENVTIPWTKPGLQLIGICPGSMGVNWSPTGTASFALIIQAMDTHVAGFNFWDDGDGIYCDWDGTTSGTYGENVVINNCTFGQGMDTAIQLEYSWYAKIENCHFNGLDSYGIVVSTSGSGISYASINDNWFQECAIAMTLGEIDSSNIYNNRIYNNDAMTSGTGIGDGLITSAGTYNIISDNYFSCLLCNWDNFNSGDTTDAWINNHCLDGLATSTPA